MKELYRVSRWIALEEKRITPRHSLWEYAEKDNDGKSGYVYCFRWNGRFYALGQFLSRFGMLGFDYDCKEYPSFITGYDGDGDLYAPLLCELEEGGERIRLYLE